MVVFISTHAPLRGIWEWVAVLFIALVVSLIALYGLWGTLRGWYMLLHVQISMAGYIFLSTWLFAVWLVTFLYFDRLTYIIFSTGQVRVRQAIGDGEKTFDVTNMSLELQPNVFSATGYWASTTRATLSSGPAGRGRRCSTGPTSSASVLRCGRSNDCSSPGKSNEKLRHARVQTEGAIAAIDTRPDAPDRRNRAVWATRPVRAAELDRIQIQELDERPDRHHGSGEVPGD
jgi:hypothetical protein